MNINWNYRLVTLPDGGNCGCTTTGVYEVYYGAGGNPISRTLRPVTLFGDDEVEIRGDYDLISEAFAKLVLTEEDFPSDKETL